MDDFVIATDDTVIFFNTGSYFSDVIGFIDGTLNPIARPTVGQGGMFNGHDVCTLDIFNIVCNTYFSVVIEKSWVEVSEYSCSRWNNIQFMWTICRSNSRSKRF